MKSSNPEIRVKAGYAIQAGSVKKCDFAGTDCWKVRIHPRIDSVSASEGYAAGG